MTPGRSAGPGSTFRDQRWTLGAFIVAVAVLAGISSYAVRNARLLVRYGTAVEQH